MIPKDSETSGTSGRRPYMNEPTGGSWVLLLVEDNEADVIFFRRAVGETSLHLPVAVARDGEEALHYIAAVGPYSDRELHPPPSIVLLDLRLPRKSGLDVLRWIQEKELA